ncbi:hypothetical protein BDR07DRAFT_1481731 [Suillus spraguei]|nr:hypothetical protein BDR07DRAFT_1481731 [Suillus spraguei]
MATVSFFKMDTRMEVVSTIATYGHDINIVRQAVMMYIVAKKKKGSSEKHIHEKLGILELKFMHIESLHPAFRDARALFQLCKSDHIPMPMSIVCERENEQRRQSESESSSMPPSSPVASSPSTYTSSSASTYTLSSASNYRLSSASTCPSSMPSAASVPSTRPTSVVSAASVPSTSNSPSHHSWDGANRQNLLPGHHTPSHAHPSRRDTALSLLSQYSEESLSQYSDEPEPNSQVSISQSGNLQN